MSERTSDRQDLLRRRRRNRKRLALSLACLALGALALVFALARGPLGSLLSGEGVQANDGAVAEQGAASRADRAARDRARVRRPGTGANGERTGSSAGGGTAGASRRAAASSPAPAGGAGGGSTAEPPEEPGEEEGLLDPITGLLPDEGTELLGEAEGLLEDPPLPDPPADPTGELLEGLAPEDLIGGLATPDTGAPNEAPGSIDPEALPHPPALDPGALENPSAAGAGLEVAPGAIDPGSVGGITDPGSVLGQDLPADLGDPAADADSALGDLGDVLDPDL